MRNKILYILIGIILALGITVSAAPTQQFFQDIFPQTTNTYVSGSSTRQWLRVSTQNASTTNLTATNAWITTQNIGSLTIDSLAVSPFIVGGTASSTIYGDGQTSVFGGGLTVNGVLTSTSSVNLATVGGNVGIATTTSLSTTGYGLNISTSTNIFGKLTVGTGTLDLFSGNIINNSGQFNIVNQANSNLTFYTNNAERMRINNSGNVGIGTASPDERLVVSGTGVIRFKVKSTDSIAAFRLDGTNDTTAFDIARNGSNQWGIGIQGSSNGDLRFWDAPAGDKIRFTVLQTSGNVGIGYTSPTVLLDVNGAARFSGVLTATSSVNLATVGGNVGIGTTTPNSKLTVSGNAFITNPNATTSIEIGQARQTKGSCLVMYDVVGDIQYVRIIGGAFSITTDSCK